MLNFYTLKTIENKRRSALRFVRTVVAVMSLAIFSQTVAALDPSSFDFGFGTNGTRLSEFDVDVQGRAVAIAPDGKIVVAGEATTADGKGFAVARYDLNGQPDPTFDLDGRILFPPSGNDAEIRAVAVQPDGKIVVGGFRKTPETHFFILRLNADGSLDPTFNETGYTDTEIGTDSDKINALALQPDGKIVAAGVSSSSGNIHFAVARYLSNGALDKTFSTDGKVVTALGAIDMANAVVLQPDGKIVIGGKSLIGSGYDFSLVRYKPDGQVDGNFPVSTSIRPNDDQIRGLALQPDGKIIAAGGSEDANATSDVALARYNSDGSLDSSFDGDGKVLTAVGDDNLANAVAVQRNGKILVAGINIPTGSISQACLVSYLPTGVPDPQFGFTGKVLYQPVGGADNSANAVALQPNGRIVMAGTSENSAGKKQFIMRLRGYRAPRADFDGDYKADLSIYRPSENNFYILGSGGNQPTITNFGLPGDLATPGDFDADGRADIAVFRPSDGNWYRLNSRDNSFSAVHFGMSGDVPMPADYDGDGFTDLAVYRPEGNIWYIWRSKTGVVNIKHFGTAGDIPVRGDFDGNGNDNVAVFRPSTGTWYYSNAGDQTISTVQFGLPGDIPVSGDFDGTGLTQIAVFRPSNGIWYKLFNNQAIEVLFGQAGDVPVPADYDRDGKADIAVWRPADGNYYVRQSSDNQSVTAHWGQSGDVPVAGF
jgi:uncharacterized delta-60 repeat protein